jgi:hypothetical protein
MKTLRFPLLVSILAGVLLLAFGRVQAQGNTVYVTPKGEKYHTATCRYVDDNATSYTVTEAKEKGYAACLVCKPSTSTSTGAVQSGVEYKTVAPAAASTPRSTSVQCSGITQSGARCKRMTTSASGRCYQH